MLPTIPPHSTQAEEALIGSMLIDNDIINLCELTKDDFYNNTLGKIYDLCKRIKSIGKSVDIVILKEYLETNNILDEVGGVQYIVELTESVGMSGNWKEYQDIIKDKSIRRDISRRAQEMKRLVEDESIDARQSLRSIDTISNILFHESKGNTIVDLVDDFEEIRTKFNKRGALGYDGPYHSIDLHTKGIIEGTVYMIAAYSNVGKSSLAYSYVCHLLKAGKKVIFFSLEVPKGILMTHLARCYYNKSQKEIMDDDFYFSLEDFENLQVFDDKWKLDEIENITRVQSPDAVFIDFVQNVELEGKGEYEKMTNAARRIQKLASETDSTIFNISQVNNDSRGRASSMQPKGSGALFASSDVIIGMYRDNHELKINLIKNKFGQAQIDYLVLADFEKLQFSITRDLSNNTANDKPIEL